MHPDLATEIRFSINRFIEIQISIVYHWISIVQLQSFIINFELTRLTTYIYRNTIGYILDIDIDFSWILSFVLEIPGCADILKLLLKTISERIVFSSSSNHSIHSLKSCLSERKLWNQNLEFWSIFVLSKSIIYYCSKNGKRILYLTTFNWDSTSIFTVSTPSTLITRIAVWLGSNSNGFDQRNRMKPSNSISSSWLIYRRLTIQWPVERKAIWF